MEVITMSERELINEKMLDDVVGGNLTYQWYGGNGTCGLNGKTSFKFNDINAFESFMKDCFENKGMSDVETLKAMKSAGIIWK